MNNTVKGIVAGFVIALTIGMSAGSMFYVLKKVREHDKIFTQHAQAVQMIWDKMKAEEIKGKKSGRKR
jgi:hypothetical protein